MSDYDPNRPERVVLQLSRAALERLLGGDSLLEVELRQQIAQNFAKKHLRGMIATDLKQQVDSAFNGIVAQEIKDQIGIIGSGSWFPTSYLNDRIKTTIKAAVDDAIKEYVTSAVIEGQRQLVQKIEEKVNYVLNMTIVDKIKQGVDDKLKEVAARL